METVVGELAESGWRGLSDDELVDVLRRVETAGEVTASVTPTGAVVEPKLSEAAVLLRAGAISDEHVQVLRQAVRTLPDRVDLSTCREVEQTLAGHARKFDPLVLGRLAKRIQLHLDPERSLRSEEQTAGLREFLVIRQVDGMYRLRGRLDAEAASTLMTALSPLAAPQVAVDGVKDQRTGAQRNADALVELARRALGSGELPRQGGQRPQVTVTVAYETLTKGLGNAGVAVLDNGEPITAEAARRIACDCQVVPMVLGSKSEPLDVGREQRVVTAAIRRALVARDGGCAFPGRDRPPGWCEAHHRIHWLDGGVTSVDNTLLLCGHHHGQVHAQGWEIVMIDQHPNFVPPSWVDSGPTPRRNHMHRPLT